MLLCRRLLPQVLKSRVVPLTPSSKLLFRRIRSASKGVDVYTTTPAISPVSAELDGTYTSNQPLGHALKVELLLDKLSQPSFHETGPVIGGGGHTMSEEELVEDALDIYKALRNCDRTALVKLPLFAFLGVANRAAKAKSMAVTNYLAADTIEVMAGHVDQLKIAESLIMNNTSLLRCNMVTDLLSLLEPADTSAHVPLKTFERLVQCVVNSREASNTSLGILSSRIIVRLSDLPAPVGAAVVSYNPPVIVKLSFILARRLLGIHQDHRALELFQALVTSRNIPPEAIHQGNEGPGNFQFVILSTLVTSSLHWGWRGLAISITKHMVKSPESDVSMISLSQLVEEVLHTILETPVGGDVADSSSLICDLDRRDIDFVVPNSLFHFFYDAAEKQNLGKDAENLYAYTQCPTVLKKTQYPPPRGRALTWLMQHLTVTNRNMHLGRSLAKQVVQMDLPIPLQDRARFIAITADHGYGTEARALWERYSDGGDRNMVVGNATTMLRIVSLFMNILKRMDTALEKLGTGDADSRTSEEDENVFGEGMVQFGTQVEAVSHTAGASESLSPKKSVKDVTAFVERVASEYRKSKEPLAGAPHFDLSSLARAYFVLGNVSAGFDVFKILMDRREIPDLHDVNIALGAMAAYSPRDATRMIERMIEKGLKPDAITIGTVLHHAIMQGDMPLVASLVRKSRDLDQGQLTLKSMASLIRASVLRETGATRTLRANLERALDIIRSLTDSRFVCTPNTGKYCILASLRVNDPVMAFRFWSLLIKDKAEWEDREQVFQRRLIADLIRKHWAAGWISRDQGMMMLSQLKVNTTLEKYGRSRGHM